MTWNYRIMRNTKGKHVWLGLHEVYYNEKGQPYMWSGEPIIAVDEEEGIDGIKATLAMMMADVKLSGHDILTYKDNVPDVVEQTILEQGGGHDHKTK